MAKRFNSHSTAPFQFDFVYEGQTSQLDFVYQDQISLDIIIELYLLDSLDKVVEKLEFFREFCRVQSSLKNRVVRPGPYHG